MRTKQLTVNNLALGNLKQRRKQYTILIIGIILAMVFSSSTLFFLSSSNETFREKQFNSLGNQHAIIAVYEEEESIFSKAIEDGIITDYTFAHIIGYGYMSGSDRAMGTAIAWLDDKCKELSNQSFIEGSYPQNENEIAIEQSALLKLGLDAKVGDKITLAVDIQDGDNYFGTAEKTYKLVGIVTDKRQNLNPNGDMSSFIPAAFVAQGTQTEVGGKEVLSAYVSRPDDADLNSLELYLWLSENSNSHFNAQDYSAYWGDDFFSGITANGHYIIVIAVVFIFVSCISIINAFNTNLKERKKQIGLLRAVGATKRQIIKIFGREAFIISLICTPISIAISYGIVRIAISLMSEEAVMTKSFSVLVLSAMVSIIITMLSALIPLLHASRITPMQAIRNIENNRKMNTKKIKAQKDFDVPSLLAKRNTQFYKGGKIAVSSILIATIIFSCLGFSLINYAKDNMYYSGHCDYELSNMGDSVYVDYVNEDMSGMSEADKREVEAYPYFSEVISEKQINAILEVDEISDYFRCFYDIKEKLEMIEENTENIQEYISGFSRGENILPVPIYSFDERTVKTLEDSLTSGEINYEKLASGEKIILIAPQSAKYAEGITDDGRAIRSSFYDGKAVPENYNVIYEGVLPFSVGDKINLSILENTNRKAEEGDPDKYSRTDREVTIGAIISPRKLDGVIDWGISDDFAFLTIHSGMSFFSANAKYKSLYMNVDADTEIDADLDKAITDFLNAYDEKYFGWFNSVYANNQKSKDDTNFLLVAMVSIVLIAFVVCAAIINNSLTASIREKKKEIGTLRAVGADIGVLVKSYIRQLLSMLGVGYGAGFSVFCIIYALIVIICKIKNEGYEFVFSPWETLAFCLVLFAICSINLWSKVKKEMKNSIVDNIREL